MWQINKLSNKVLYENYMSRKPEYIFKYSFSKYLISHQHIGTDDVLL